MADPQQAVVQSTFPPPPAYYVLCKSDRQSTDDPPLQPPQPPASGEYTTFGELNTVETGFPPLHVRQLYEKGEDGTVDFKGQLKKLLAMLMLSFLSLLDTLVKDPMNHGKKLTEVNICFRNIHHVLNLLRPVQAQMTMAHMLRQRIQRRKAALEDLRRTRQHLQQLLQLSGAQIAELWDGKTLEDRAGIADAQDMQQ